MDIWENQVRRWLTQAVPRTPGCGLAQLSHLGSHVACFWPLCGAGVGLGGQVVQPSVLHILSLRQPQPSRETTSASFEGATVYSWEAALIWRSASVTGPLVGSASPAGICGLGRKDLGAASNMSSPSQTSLVPHSFPFLLSLLFPLPCLPAFFLHLCPQLGPCNELSSEGFWPCLGSFLLSHFGSQTLCP